MHTLDQRLLGILILFLLGMLVVVKQRATGSIIDKPHGSFLIQLVNAFNLFFLLVVNPLAAILLILRRLESVDLTHLTIEPPWLLTVVEIAGLLAYGMGFFLMSWALIRLGGSYQLGGSTPRPVDELVMKGPYRLVRHPMYTAALCISLGLACLIQSWAFLGVFCAYLVLILLLIPVEEDGLRTAYGERYLALQRQSKKLIPFVY